MEDGDIGPRNAHPHTKHAIVEVDVEEPHEDDAVDEEEDVVEELLVVDPDNRLM